MEDWTGRVLSKVRIEKLIGRGGMADVYVGRHTTLNRPMAVKILHQHMTVNADLRRRFRDEAQAVAALRHPNIVQVFDFDVIEDRPYIVMELLVGMPLNEYLSALHAKGHTLPLDTVSHIMNYLTSALDYAHDRQIVHRDVKPANIILRSGDTPIRPEMPLAADVEPVLTDFGVARIATSSTPTISGTILGTPAYMSPEQVRGEAVDRRSDIYALGIILYEVLAGKLPFNPETDTPASILFKHVHEPPPIVPNVSPAIQRVVEKALAKDREARFQQAGELAADFKVATKSRTVASPPSPAVTAVSAAPAPSSEIPAPSAPARKLRPSLTLIAGIVVGAIVLVGGVVVGGQIVGGSSEDPTAAPVQTESVGSLATEAVAQTSTGVSESATSAPAVEIGPIAAVIVRDGDLEAQIPGVEAAPAGQSYHAWLLGAGGVPPLHLNLEGTVNAVGGELLISYSDSEGRNLLSVYTKFVVSLEDEGSVLTAPTTSVFEGNFDPAVAELIQLADQEKGEKPVLANLRSWLPLQAGHFNTHSGFVLDGIQRGDLAYVKEHSEHSLNIVEGRMGELYFDWDGNGIAVNPGDKVGVVPYVLLLRAASEGASRAEIQRGGSGETGIEIADRAGDLADLLFDIRETLRQILGVDTVGDISGFGMESNLTLERELQSRIAQLVSDSEALDLAFSIDIFRSQ
ncbi:MAG: serine/threonine protein kinase [Chloroflexi bacterium]|nr:serine/threonine protein kinase [Chloroflexota bacterium]